MLYLQDLIFYQMLCVYHINHKIYIQMDTRGNILLWYLLSECGGILNFTPENIFIDNKNICSYKTEFP